jgi:hypothetical protein
MIDGPERDAQAYERRTAGRSYGAIARELGYDNAPAATAAFLRVLSSREADEQGPARVAEHARLDALAGHVQADTELTPAALTRRLAVIQRMHEAVDLDVPTAAEHP